MPDEQTKEIDVAMHESRTLDETLDMLNDLRRRNSDAILQHESDLVIKEVDRENAEEEAQHDATPNKDRFRRSEEHTSELQSP